jgi:hypothetical protein
VIDDLIGRFLLQIMAGGERLRVDEIARVLAPHGWIFLRRRRSPCSPQDQKRHPDLAILVGRIQYSPFIFTFEGQKIIPAESVYAIFEAKQTLNAELVRARVSEGCAGRACRYHMQGAHSSRRR